VISKRVPGQVGDCSMILMKIAAVLGKMRSGETTVLSSSKVVLISAAWDGKKPFRNVWSVTFEPAASAQEPAGAGARFPGPRPPGGENDPVE